MSQNYLLEWNIPSISGSPLPLSLEAGDRLFVVGANGSGKSALLQYLASTNSNTKVKRIFAHRQTWLNSGSIDFTPHSRKQFEESRISLEFRHDAQWIDHDPQGKQSAVLFDLVAKENTRARSIAQHIDNNDPKKAIASASNSASPFDQLNRLLALGTLKVSLENSNDEEILARYRNDEVSFSIAQMSDGERNAAIIAATVLTLKSGTILLIDEPERHLHRAIIEPFLSALFEQRRDCAFVVSTHEIALPVANPDANIFMVRSCKWNGERPIAWDIEILEKDVNLPEELKLAILGGRRRILFVEGTSNSLDWPLYNALFPDLSIVSKGSHRDVQKAVSGLSGLYDHHHVEAFGLIDGDGRTEDEIKELEEIGVFALDVYSAEALYYCSEAVAAVAGRQAESLGSDASGMIEAVRQNVLILLKQEDIAERMAARRCERLMHNRLQLQARDWKSIKANADPKINVCINSPYPNELKRFKELINEENIDDLIARYPLRESGVICKVATALRCSSRKDYEQMVISRIINDDELAQALRQRIAPLSAALGIGPAGPENNAS